MNIDITVNNNNNNNNNSRMEYSRIRCHIIIRDSFKSIPQLSK